MAMAERRGRARAEVPVAARSARLGRSAGRHDKRMRDDAVPATTVTEQTATLLWEACRREPRADSVRRALAGGANIGWAVSAASEQRIGPLLWRALGAAGSLDALGHDGAALGYTADASKMEALLLLPRAVALAVRPLTDAGLEPVVFKGPAVAARYPEPGLRPMDDIDLLLPQADHRRALDALGHAGWQVARPGGRDTNATVLNHREVPSFFLEVHYALEGASQRVTALDPGTLWAMRQPLECAGTSAFGLPPAEELVVLATHAGGPHHRFVRLVWMADLAMIVGAAATHGAAVDWDRVRAVAGAARCVTVVGAALEMARRAGLDAPAGLFPLPTEGRRGDAMRRLLSVTWPLTNLELPGWQLRYALTDARAQRVKIFFAHFVRGHGIRARARRVAGLPPRAVPRPQPPASA
jgi:hypothetical protein